MHFDVHMGEYDTFDYPPEDEYVSLTELIEASYAADRKVNQVLQVCARISNVMGNYCTAIDHTKRFGVTAPSMHLMNYKGGLSRSLKLRLPSYESDDLAEEVIPEDVDEEVFVEAADGAIKKAKDAVVAFFKRIVDYLKELYEKHIALAGRLFKTLEELRTKFKKTPDIEHYSKIEGTFFSQKDFKDATSALDKALGFKWSSEAMSPETLAKEFSELDEQDVTAKFLSERFEVFNKALMYYGKQVMFEYTPQTIDGKEVHVPKLLLEEYDDEGVLMKKEDVKLTEQWPSHNQIATAISECLGLLKQVQRKKDIHKKIEKIAKDVASYDGKTTSNESYGIQMEGENPVTDTDPPETPDKPKGAGNAAILLSQNVTNALIQVTNEVVKITVSKHVLSLANLAKKVKFK